MVGFRCILSLTVALSLASLPAHAADDGSCADSPILHPIADVAALVTTPINASCKAIPTSKTYPSGQGAKSWYGRTVTEVRCDYECRSDNFPTITIAGSRMASFWGSEDGNELICYGIPYEERYNAYRGWFVFVPMEPKSFNPAKSDVAELKHWASGKPWPMPPTR